MKKVLIIANLFHASPRIPGLAKYLPEFGWQPIFLTPPIGKNSGSHFGPPNDFKSNNRVIETYGYSSSYGKRRLASRKYRSIRSFLKFFYKYYREIVQYPDAEKSWKPFALEASIKLLRSESIDAIVSSSSPATSHFVAKELKTSYRIPWVAEFRDLWTQNPNYAYSHLRKFFERRLELKTLSNADTLVTLADPAAETLRALHKKKVFTITNGFDPEEMSKEKSDLTSKFTITYTGQIYTRKQDPSKLLVALEYLISNGTMDPNDLQVRFYGPEDDFLQEEVGKLGLSNVVNQCGIVPRHIAFQKQRESQILLLLNWEDPKEKSVYTGKIFEYLAAQRPILAAGGFGNDVVEALLKETDSGTYCPTVEDIRDFLVKSYSVYKLKGKVTYQGRIEEINKYSYREIAREYSEILDDLVKERRHKA